MATNAASVAQANESWLLGAGERNYAMPSTTISQVGQTLDIELESVPGWADAVELNVFIDNAITVATGGTAPSLSEFAPWNLFRSVELSLGGGPFVRVSPYFCYLREMVMRPGWNPAYGGPNAQSYASSVYSVPAVTATAGSTTDNYWAFSIRVPMQVQHGSVFGHIPLGNSSVKGKVRLTLQNTMWGTDHYQNPLVGGSGVTVAIGTTKTSYVQPNILYRTTPPSASHALPNPTIGYVLNVQEKVTPITTAGSLIPVKFPDPFKYLRLWHIVINGNGVPDSSDVTGFEYDLLPGYPQWNYPNSEAMQQYFTAVRRMYRQDLPAGVFVFDFWSGSDPANPNGTQVVDATLFQTNQSQLMVSSATVVGGPAKIITYAEALSPVAF